MSDKIHKIILHSLLVTVSKLLFTTFIYVFIKKTYPVLYFCLFSLRLSLVNLAKPDLEDAVFLIKFLNPPLPLAFMILATMFPLDQNEYYCGKKQTTTK